MFRHLNILWRKLAKSSGYLNIVEVCVQMGEGAHKIYECIDRRPSVVVLLHDPKLDKVLLIQEFCVGSFVAWGIEAPYGLPGGDVDKDESPRDAATREVHEETDIMISPENLITIAEDRMICSRTSNARISYFYVETDLSHVDTTKRNTKQDGWMQSHLIATDDFIKLNSPYDTLIVDSTLDYLRYWFKDHLAQQKNQSTANLIVLAPIGQNSRAGVQARSL